MNKTVTLIKTALVFATLSVVVVNANTETDYVNSFSGRTDIPVPVKVSTPYIQTDHSGKTISVSFYVSEDGRVFDVSFNDHVEDALKTAIADALIKWEFKPLIKNGSPVKTKVVLPIVVL